MSKLTTIVGQIQACAMDEQVTMSVDKLGQQKESRGKGQSPPPTPINFAGHEHGATNVSMIYPHHSKACYRRSISGRHVT